MLRRYLKDTSGQFAVMFAAFATMLVIAVGASVDMIGIQKNKTHLQAITDVAVLAAARAKTDNKGQLKKIAEAAVAANNPYGLDIKIKLTVKEGVINVTGTTNYDTQLMNLVGIKDLPVNAVSEAPVPKDVPVNIALVLDSTGSMSGANMDALRSASKKLLQTFDDADPGTIQVGVIPFSTYVNVGLSNRNRSWMEVEADGTTTGAEKCYMRKDKVNPGLCTTTTVPKTCYNDSGPYTCTSTSTSCPPEAYGPEYEYCYTPTSTRTWYGCVGSRPDPHHKNPGYKGKKFPGIMNVSCGSEILDLTTNMDQVNDKIDSLIASGNTYIPAGLAWGWRMLDPDLPYGGLTNSQPDRKRAMILMTDGANTVRLSAPYHYSDTDKSDTGPTDTLTADLCQGIKDAGIDLYSVAYKLGSGDPATEKMIEDCASTPSFFFSADNQDDLEQAFEDIAMSLYEVRLSK